MDAFTAAATSSLPSPFTSPSAIVLRYDDPDEPVSIGCVIGAAANVPLPAFMKTLTLVASAARMSGLPSPFMSPHATLPNVVVAR